VALDQFPGLFRWTKEAFPDVKSIGFTGWDLGEPLNTDLRTLMTKAIADAGYQFNGLLEQFAPNSSDFSQVLPKVKSNLPDLLLLYAFGQDCGLFQNQAQSTGLDVKTVGFEFTPDGLNGAKGAFERGWTFTYDYFNADTAASPLGKLFVDEYRSANKGDPDFYAANYYEDTLAMWDLIRRVLASGGDPNSGTDLENALKANPTFVSVYGGDASTNGTLKLDLTTHSVSQRFMGVFTYKNGKVTTDATFDIGGIPVVVDNVSIKYLKGSVVDYITTDMGGGFKIENPNAVKSCGCGSSFSADDETAGGLETSAGGGCGSCGCH